MSLLRQYAEAIGEEAARDYVRSARFKDQIKRHVKWAVQGFEPGYGFKEREAFTQTVADRIHDKARVPVSLFGRRIWRKRMPVSECLPIAECIVEAFLHDEKIKFGDPRYDWSEGSDLADADMEYWESCP